MRELGPRVRGPEPDLLPQVDHRRHLHQAPAIQPGVKPAVLDRHLEVELPGGLLEVPADLPRAEAPILERSEVDPYLTASPCVLVENRLWRMWYVLAVLEA